MYSERIILANLDNFARQEGWHPQYHSRDEIQEFSEYINSITRKEVNSRNITIDLNRELTARRAKEIRRFVENEQALCNPPEAPIWMANHKFKCIGDIEIGDKVIGWARIEKPGKKNPSKSHNYERLVITEVVEIYKRRAPIVKITMESGRTIRCTKDHLWSNGATYRSLIRWVNPKIGRTLRRVVDVYPNEPHNLRTAAWLGGMYDGEGSGPGIFQSPSHNPEVCAAIEKAFCELGFDIGIHSPGEKLASAFYINGSISAYARFLAWCDPVKKEGLEKRIYRCVKAKPDKIVSIEPDGEGEVVSMKTGTGNYVAWGYMSKNCMFDSHYFEDRYAWVCDEKGNIFKFTNRKAQEIFDNIIAEFDDKQVAIELFILKARQLGITTKTALKFLHRMLFLPHTQAVMGSVNEGKSELISRIIETCIARLPWWLIPRRSTDRIKLIGFVNGSIMSVQSGNQATGVAQGWTPTCVHLSEIGDIPNPKKIIEEGLFRATHSSRKLFLVLEGTGNGNTGWQADKWRACKEDWPLGKSRLMPFFVNWPMAPDLYPEADWLRKFPIPGGFKPIEATRKHTQRCELFIRNSPYLAKVAGKHWRMPVEQQWFWEFNYLEATKSHTQKVWLSQMPADDYEALQGVNDLVFDSIVIDSAREQRKRGYQAYAITGDSIDDGFEPDEQDIDYEKERIRVVWNSHRGQRFEWIMVPLLPFDDNDERKALDKVLIFEEPNSAPGREGDREDYSIGIDTADGLGQEDEERSALEITRNVTGESPDVQVAELCSNRINAPQMVGFAACLAAWYGHNTKDPRGCKFAIEQRMRPGDDCQLQLKLMGFTFHHIDTRYDSKDVKENKGTKQGWYSNAWSVPLLVNRFVDAINNGWYIPHSPFLIKELGSLERKVSKTGKSKMEHMAGKFDDRFRAAAQSYFTRHAFDVMAERAQVRYAPPVDKLPELNLSYAKMAEVSVGE